MLLLSFRPGTNVKARGLGRPARIVGFIADDDGQSRIVVSFPRVGGEGVSHPARGLWSDITKTFDDTLPNED